jgi:aerobic carbon-monoxide dehydrogenase medium subunit
MYDFTYCRPKTLAEAAALLEQSKDSKPLSGGMSLVPVMRHRLAHPSALIDLGAIAELRGVEMRGDALRIGAATTHFAVSRSPLVVARIPALAKLAGGIGDPLVRNRGTIGGSLANNDPAACYPSSILALDAVIETNRREVSADDFILDMFQTALEPGEIIIGVRFPAPSFATYIKFANLSSRFSIVGLFLARRSGRVRIGITGAGHCAFRPRDLEQALTVRFTPETARGVAISPRELQTDTHASAEFRAQLISELAAEAVAEAITAGAT